MVLYSHNFTLRDICAPHQPLLGGNRSGEMNASVSFQAVNCLARSVSRNIALLEDKELVTDLTHDRQQPFSQKNLTVHCV